MKASDPGMSGQNPPPELLETAHWAGPGYRSLVAFGQWRTALMNFDPKYRPEALELMEAHRDTDEVFVLLEGHCTLVLGRPNSQAGIGQLWVQPMAKGVLYNIPRGGFHTHALSEDAVVLVVENRDTGDHNTDFLPIGPQAREHMLSLLLP
jgi:hypothetical protein